MSVWSRERYGARSIEGETYPGPMVRGDASELTYGRGRAKEKTSPPAATAKYWRPCRA